MQGTDGARRSGRSVVEGRQSAQSRYFGFTVTATFCSVRASRSRLYRSMSPTVCSEASWVPSQAPRPTSRAASSGSKPAAMKRSYCFCCASVMAALYPRRLPFPARVGRGHLRGSGRDSGGVLYGDEVSVSGKKARRENVGPEGSVRVRQLGGASTRPAAAPERRLHIRRRFITPIHP